MHKLILRIVIAAVLAIGSSSSALAIQANPHPVIVSQPDGTTLTIRIHGNENFHYVTTSDGFLVGRDSDGYFKYLSGGFGRTLSTVKAHNITERTIAEQAYVSQLMPIHSAADVARRFPLNGLKRVKTPEQVLNLKCMKQRQKAASVSSISESQYLVVLVQYADDKLTYTIDDFQLWLNEPGYSVDGGTGSVKDYYRDNSMGQFVPNFTVLGPYTLDHNEAYYAENDNSSGDDCNPGEMIIEAVTKAKAAHPEIDFSQFDNDGDGYMDNVNVIFSGYGEASSGESQDMWPHSYRLSSLDMSLEVDGISINNYSVSAELVGASGGKMDGIGTFTHEFGHILGLKDMYDTDDYDQGLGINPGDYSIFASGSYNNNSRTPPCLMAFERMQMGWLEPTQLKDTADIELQSVADNMACYIDAQPNLDWATQGGDYYMLENRQQTGWDTYIPAHGLLIYHYDYTAESVTTYWSVNGPNNNANHRCLYIVPADGIDDDLTRKGDTYPGTTGSTEFIDQSHPEAVSWTGEKLRTPITNITEESDGIVRFKVKGGTSNGSFIRTVAPTDADISDSQITVGLTVTSKQQGINTMGFLWSDTNEFPTLSEDNKATVDIANKATYTITGLSPATKYFVRAYMTMEDGTTVYGASIPVTTEHAVAQAPYAYVFNEWEGEEPVGWRIIDNNGDGITWIQDASTESIVYQYDYWNNADDWLISERMHVPERGALYLVRGVNEMTCVEKLEIYVSTESRSISDFHLVKTLTLADNFGEQTVDEVDISDYAGDDVYVAIVAKSDKLQNSIWLWEVLLTSKLDTPQITDFSAISNGLHLEWTPVEDAKYYYLDFLEVTDSVNYTSVFLPEDDIESAVGDVEVGTGLMKFIGSGTVETISYPDSITGIQYLLKASGSRGSSTLAVEGSNDGQTWERIGELQRISSNDSEGSAIDLTDYLDGKFYTKLRIRSEYDGRLLTISNFTVTYRNGTVWNSLAAGRVDNASIDITETSSGEFFTGKRYAAEVYAGDGLLFYDASEPAFYQYGTDGIMQTLSHSASQVGHKVIRVVANNGIVQLANLAKGRTVSLYSADGVLLKKFVPTSTSAAISLPSYNGVVIARQQ